MGKRERGGETNKKLNRKLAGDVRNLDVSPFCAVGANEGEYQQAFFDVLTLSAALASSPARFLPTHL